MNARLASRGRRGFKPRAGARINWAHPLTRGLVLCAPYYEVGGPPRDLSRSPAPGSFIGTGTVWVPSPHGPALRQTGAAGSAVSFGNPVKLQFGNASSFTIFSIIGPEGGGTTRCILGNDTFAPGRPLIQWNVTSAEKVNLGVGDVDFVLGSVTGATSVPVNSGRLFSAAGVRDVAADTLYAYLDGVQDAAVTDDSTGTWQVTAGEWRSAYNVVGGAASNNWQGRKVLDLIYDRALSAAEIAQLHADPWQLFLSDGLVESDLFVITPPNLFARSALPFDLRETERASPLLPVEWRATLEPGLPLPAEWLVQLEALRTAPFDTLQDIASRAGLPVEWDGTILLNAISTVPTEWLGALLLRASAPVEFRAALDRILALPFESVGLDPFALPVTWRVIHRLTNDFPLLVTWGSIANPIQNATLQVTWQSRSAPLALAIRWTILPGASGGPFPSDTPAPIVSSFTDTDIHQPVATASKTP